MRLVFFGTASFAVPSLQALLRTKHQVLALVTQPDRPKGRGRELTPPPVKEAAKALKIPILQPDSLQETEFLEALRSLKPDLAVVVAFGRLLPSPLLQIFPKGAVNLHASLLPKYRGAAPIQWALIHGETETGVTIFQIDTLLDHGPILLQAKHAIRPEDTAVTLAQSLSSLGSQILLKALDLIEAGQSQAVPQQESLASPAPRLTKEDGLIDWKNSCVDIRNRIRGVQPWPGAITWIGKERIKLLSTTADLARHDSKASAGTVVLADPQQGLWIQTGKGQLRIDRLQREGGDPLEAGAFLRGHPIPLGTQLTRSPAVV